MVDAIYIHIPFCKSLCSYCDFLSFSCKSKEEIERYVEYLIKEIGIYRNSLKEEIEFDTVYFGGGTPSLLEPDQIKRVLNELKLKKDSEVTLEVNPKTVDLEKLKKFRESGINRVSIGIQSFSDTLLKTLGRAHKSSEAIEVYQDARAAGFDNISLDLMFSLPEESLIDLEKDLDKLFELNPEHFSIYSLIWEEGTPFYQKLETGELAETENELEAEMFHLIIEKSREKMYNHYEISNFCKSGFEARHNTKYWRNQEYLGIGLGASGYISDERYKNFSNFEEYYMYIDSNKKPVETSESVDDELFESYRNMLGLRLLNEGVAPSETYKEKFEELFRGGFLEKYGESYRLTEKGLFFANDVFQELI